jgi:hypothetical protein
VSNKRQVTIVVTCLRTYEIDLDDEAYEGFTSHREAAEYDAGAVFDDPVEWLDSFDEIQFEVRALDAWLASFIPPICIKEGHDATTQG